MARDDHIHALNGLAITAAIIGQPSRGLFVSILVAHDGLSFRDRPCNNMAFV